MDPSAAAPTPCPLCAGMVAGDPGRCSVCGLHLEGGPGQPNPFVNATLGAYAGGLALLYALVVAVAILAR